MDSYTKYTDIAKQDEVERFNHFTNTVLGDVTTSASTFPTSIEPYEIGYVLDYQKIDVLKLKKKIASKTPVMSLYYMYHYKFSKDIDNQIYAMEDADFRNKCAVELYTDQLIFSAMMAGGRNIQNELLSMWKLFLNKFVLDPNTILPQKVSLEMENWVIKQRCGLDTSFLGNSNEILHKILLDRMYITKNNGVGSQILNTKQDLCEVLTDLNAIARQKTNSSILKCMKMMHTYGPSSLGEEDTGVFKKLQHNFAKFQKLVESWDNISTYSMDSASEFCNPDSADCADNVQRLHVMAAEIKNVANSCSGDVAGLRKKKLVNMRKNGSKMSLFDKVRSYL